MVFQNYALFPHMSVRRNIGFGLAMQGLAKPEIERKVDEALSIVRLGDQGDKLPGQLSGGQQQRVAIARAIVIEPPLVLMDEPLSNLDAKLRLEMRAEIRRIHELIGSATIYVTHDQEEALSLADRIVVMRDRRGAPGRHAGGTLRAAGACRRRRVHGLSQPDPLARGEIRQPGQHQRRRRQPAGHAGREPIADGEAVAAIRPDDLKVTAGGPIAATVEIGAISRPRLLLLGPHQSTAPSSISAPRKKSKKGETVRLAADPGPRAGLFASRRMSDRAADVSGGTHPAARAACAPRSRRRDAAGPARRCCSSLRLFVYPFALRLRAVVPAEDGRLAGQLHEVLLRSVPVRHDLERRFGSPCRRR